MKKTFVLSVLCVAALAFAVSAMAADHGVITINGGSQAVAMRGHAGKVTAPRLPMKKPLYSNFNSDTSNLYNSSTGWTISDGNILGEEFTAANSFKSPRTTKVTSIISALSWAGGTQENLVELVKDCKGQPCKVDYQGKGTLCHAKAKVTQTFGSCCAVVKTSCKASLHKGTTYWIIMESIDTDNTFTVWNWSNASNANGPDDYSLNDAAWASNGSGNPQGAFSIQ